MSDLVRAFGGLHTALVHFPVALIVAAAVAEALYAVKKRRWFGDAARFMVAAGAWTAAPAVAAGFAEAAGRTFTGEAARVFSIHWVCGVAVAVLAFLSHALSEGTRRSGQVWEQALYRLILLTAAAGVLVTGFFGGRLEP